eukprot:14208452-Alexandrium_andersonii.AAC.1
MTATRRRVLWKAGALGRSIYPPPCYWLLVVIAIWPRSESLPVCVRKQTPPRNRGDLCKASGTLKPPDSCADATMLGDNTGMLA